MEDLKQKHWIPAGKPLYVKTVWQEASVNQWKHFRETWPSDVWPRPYILPIQKIINYACREDVSYCFIGFLVKGGYIKERKPPEFVPTHEERIQTLENQLKALRIALGEHLGGHTFSHQEESYNKDNAPNHGKPWSDYDKQYLGQQIYNLSVRCGRTPWAVVVQAYRQWGGTHYGS